jgi:hypothetical protein
VFFDMEGTPGKEVGIDALRVNEGAKLWRMVVTSGAGHFDATRNVANKKRKQGLEDGIHVDLD